MTESVDKDARGHSMVEWVCSVCGGDRISVTMDVEWDREKGEWIGNAYGDSHDYCHDCETDSGASSVPYSSATWNQTFDVGDVVSLARGRDYYYAYPHHRRGEGLYREGDVPDDWTKPEGSPPAVVVSIEGDQRNRDPKYYEARETVLIRFATGGTMEVWPRDLTLVNPEEK